MPTYYVDATGGNDDNTGLSEVQAWQTLTKVSTEFAAATFGAGDSILFKRGETWTVTGAGDMLTAKGSSGAVGNHIYLGAYGTGNDPVLDGATNATYLIYRNIGDPACDYITIEDIELKRTHNYPAVLIKDAHHWALRDLYVHDLTRDAEEHTCGIRFRYNCEWIWIDQCVVDEVEGEGIYLGTSDIGDDTRWIFVSDCSITNCDYEGIDIKGATRHIFICSCTIEDTGRHAGDPTQISIGGQYNVIYQCRIYGMTGDQAVYLGRYVGDFADSGRYCRVERCLIKGATGTRGGIRIDATDNEIVNCTFVDCSYAIYGGSDAGGGHVIENNVFYNCSNEAVYVNVEGRYTFDHNDYGDGASGVWYESGASRDFACVQELGHEANGITGAPDFAETTDYTLNFGSPCVNAGDSAATVYDWNNKYAGAGTADIGWREYGWELPHRIFESLILETLERFTGYTGVGVATGVKPVCGPYSLRVHITDTTAQYVYRTGLGNLGHFYLNFYVNVDELSMAASDLFNVFEGRTAGGSNEVIVQLYNDAGTIKVRGGVIDDTAAWRYTSYFTLSTGWNLIEIFWVAAPEVGVNDGELVLWLDEVEKEHIDDLNNHDDLVDRFYVGAVSGLDVGTNGDLHVDVIRLDWVRLMDNYSCSYVPASFNAVLRGVQRGALRRVM